MKKYIKYVLSVALALTFALTGSSSVFVGAEDNAEPENHTHVLEYIPLVLPTETEDGNFPFYLCTECAKRFADENGTVEVSVEKVTLPKKQKYGIISSVSEYVYGSKKEITYFTNLPSEKFAENYSIYIGEQRVPDNEYTLKSDSEVAIITISGKAFENQAKKGEYYVTVKSDNDDSVSISTTVIISEPENNSEQTSPAFDFGQLVLIVSVSTLAIVCVVLAMLFLINKRKRSTEKSADSDD